jgi:transcriptional regulator with XRE-family HTH domain
MRKLLAEKETAMKKAFLNYPLKSDNDVAKITGISQPTISKYRKKYHLEIDSEFIAMVAGKFIVEFSQAKEHWKELIQEIELIKKKKKTVVKQNQETGGYFSAEVELDPLEQLQLIREQANLRARILFLASQGEVREVIKVMRTGQLPATN